MSSKCNKAVWPVGPVLRNIAGLVVLLICSTSQFAVAQQGAECLSCHTGLPATLSNVIAVEPAEVLATAGPVGCDYSNAELFNGWGWNASSGESCPPIENSSTGVQQTASTCDYSNSAQFNGWGWDPVAGQSCPPQQEQEPHSRFEICSATFYDADGDGFGWENEASCIVTSASAPPPVFTNKETGNEVELVRAYWDGNTDIANRIIQCDLYYYDSYWNQYQLEPVPFRSGADLNNQVFPSYRFHHLSLPPFEPYQGWIAEVAYVEGSTVTPTTFGTVPNWTTADGRYTGPTVLQTPYYELVTRENGAMGIRHWVNSRQDTALNLQFSGNRVQNDGYFECWDISGRDLQPTGTIGGGTSSPAVVSDLAFSAKPNPAQQDPQNISNLETGASVALSKAYWNYNEDLAGKTASCEYYFFDQGAPAPGLYMTGAVLTKYHFPHHFTNSGNRLYYWESSLNMETSSFVADNGVLTNPDGSDFLYDLIFASEYVEVFNQGVRFWTSSEEYSECEGIVPTGTAPEATDRNQCDYSGSEQFGGWGWNPVTRQSCAPQSTQAQPQTTISADNCDYSNAAVSGGWGWNPVTLKSCPPVAVIQTQSNAATQTSDDDACDYSNAASNSGWGWNSVTGSSCRPR